MAAVSACITSSRVIPAEPITLPYQHRRTQSGPPISRHRAVARLVRGLLQEDAEGAIGPAITTESLVLLWEDIALQSESNYLTDTALLHDAAWGQLF